MPQPWKARPKPKLEEFPKHALAQEIHRRAVPYRWRRLDRYMQKEYGEKHLTKEQAADVSLKVMVELALFGEDEKVRLLAAQALKSKEVGGGPSGANDELVNKIRSDLAGSEAPSAEGLSVVRDLSPGLSAFISQVARGHGEVLGAEGEAQTGDVAEGILQEHPVQHNRPTVERDPIPTG